MVNIENGRKKRFFEFEKKKKGKKEGEKLNAILIRLETWIEFGEENIGNNRSISTRYFPVTMMMYELI